MSEHSEEIDPAEVDRIYQELMLQKKAKEELQEEDQLTKEAIQEIVDKDVQDNYSGSLQACKALVKKLAELFNTNQELRNHNPDIEQFAESEETLYEYLRTQVMPISADNPEAVLNFIEAGGIPLLVELMDHQNSDISISCAV